MNRYVRSLGGEMIAILGADSKGVEFWRDFSLASYDIYTAEDTSLKELARGNVSVVKHSQRPLLLNVHPLRLNPVDKSPCTVGQFILAELPALTVFLLISNTATFIKNVVISVMLAYLLFHNREVRGLFSAYSQWLVGFVA